MYGLASCLLIQALGQFTPLISPQEKLNPLTKGNLMKKLNTIYHVVIIVMIGYLGIANHLLVNKVKEVQQEARIGMMISNDANFKVEMFIQMMADNHKDEIRIVLEEILKEKMD
jgi:hypothetical protein